MEANKRVLELQAEEKHKEEELYKKAAELKLAKQRTDEAREIVSIIDTRFHSTMHDSDERHSLSQLPQQTIEPSAPQGQTHLSQFHPQQTLDPSAPQDTTHPSHILSQRALDPRAQTFEKTSHSPQRPIPDLEDFLTVLDRTLIVLKDTRDKQGDVFGQSLNLISKEKLLEEDVQ